MNRPIYSAFLAIALFAGVLPVSARTSPWTDMSSPYGGYSPDSPEGNRSFWDYQTRRGGQ